MCSNLKQQNTTYTQGVLCFRWEVSAVIHWLSDWTDSPFLTFNLFNLLAHLCLWQPQLFWVASSEWVVLRSWWSGCQIQLKFLTAVGKIWRWQCLLFLGVDLPLLQLCQLHLNAVSSRLEVDNLLCFLITAQQHNHFNKRVCLLYNQNLQSVVQTTGEQWFAKCKILSTWSVKALCICSGLDLLLHALLHEKGGISDA